MAPCPSIEVLRAWFENSGRDENNAGTESHVLECPTCIQQIETWGKTVKNELVKGIGPLDAADNDCVINRIATTLPSVPLGALISGGYMLLEEIGRGSFGVVYKAKQNAPDRIVALKMLLAGVYSSPDERLRFLQEAAAIAKLQHPNVVQIIEVGEHNDWPFLALEWCGGGSLKEKLNGALQEPRQAAIFVQILTRAMIAVHQLGIVHRDLKPSNVLLTAHGEVKITDFGLARMERNESDGTASQAILGTPSYMPPEQASGNSRDAGPKADVYALGAILYEMLTGSPPFKANTATETLYQVIHKEPKPLYRINKKLPRDLETICLKCLRKEPDNRYTTAQALANDLEHFLKGRPIQARPAGRIERAWKWCRRHPARAIAASFGMLLAISLGFAGWFYTEKNAAIDDLINKYFALATQHSDPDHGQKIADELAAQYYTATSHQKELILAVIPLAKGINLGRKKGNDEETEDPDGSLQSLDEAEWRFRKLTEKARDTDRCHLGLAIALVSKGTVKNSSTKNLGNPMNDYNEGIHLLEQIPTPPIPSTLPAYGYFGRGQRYYLEKNWEIAEADLTMAHKLFGDVIPFFPNTSSFKHRQKLCLAMSQYAKARIYENKEHWENASDAMKRALGQFLEIGNKDPLYFDQINACLQQLSEYLRLQGKYLEAIPSLEEAIERFRPTVQPDNLKKAVLAEMLCRLSYLYYHHNARVHAQSIIKTLEQAKEYSPEALSLEDWSRCAAVYSVLGQFPKAIEYQTKAVELAKQIKDERHREHATKIQGKWLTRYQNKVPFILDD